MWLPLENETQHKYSFWDFKGKEDFIDEWFLMSTPALILFIALSYLMFVLKIGPQYMKNRQPFKINGLLQFYNALQVLVSCYMVYYGVDLLWPHGLVHKSCKLDKQAKKKIATGIYIYFIAKVSELLDTIFFVLRKKNNQISFLHVYHHCVMMLTTWFCLKYEPSLASVFLGTLNSLIHVVMYSYYGLSSIPSISKYLWWKKYITSLQLVQFVMIITQAIINYLYSPCPPSYALLSVIIFHASVFLYLFSAFYVKAYIKHNKNKKDLKLLKKQESLRTKCQDDSYSKRLRPRFRSSSTRG